MDNSNQLGQAKNNIAGEVLHLALLYLLLSLFIFGSLYHQSLIRNLGFGLFFTVSWFFCFLLTSWVYNDNDFTLFHNGWAACLKSQSNAFIWKKLKIIINFPVIFWLLQFVMVLSALQMMSFNLMLINILGMVALLLYCVLFIVKRSLAKTADTSNILSFCIVKLIVSIYIAWFLLYVGLMIIVINFTPLTQQLLTQVSMLLGVILTLYLANCLPNTPSTRLKWSFIIGFFNIAVMVSYFSHVVLLV
ncbi:hypothetical protein [Legionella oakridgensis]|uniref:hypothetical protein n=1 Tax=Legionella oakridgensis TaxID=29423 RepID=UPI0003DDFBAC|nr:hypothetical protein [Legionella oakridgensis]ETO93423.1 hypothetical protein LOR_27c02210 [Legionella oakridgensis RV-2-2007]